MFRFRWRLNGSREAIREYFALAGCMISVERLETTL
jgi:hypothetical protein